MHRTTETTEVRLEDIDWREIVELDRRRPGTGRGRLIKEQIPVWALIGLAGVLAHTTVPEVIGQQAIMEAVAADYGIPLTAMMAAVGYYMDHCGPIDAILEVSTH